jgi:hypothetical protein
VSRYAFAKLRGDGMKRGAGALAGLTVAMALSSAAPAAGATPEALATKQLAAAEKAARTAYRASLAAAQIQLFAAIADVESALPAAATPLEPGNDLFDALETFQEAVFVASNLASNAQAEAAKAALATLGAELGGIYPDAFYPGGGTPTERFETAIANEAAKAYAKVGKRLGKIAGRFRAEGFALSFRIQRPVFTDSRTWSETTVDFVLAFPPTVDLVVAWSDLAVLGDGQLRAAGTGFQIGPPAPIETGPVQITVLAHTGVDTLLDRTAEPEAGRWRSDLDGTALPEGVYLVATGQQVVTGTDVTIGVR